MSDPAEVTGPRKTIDEALEAIVSNAADKAAERVLHQAAAARVEVEQELFKLTAERTAMIQEISTQVESAAARADRALAEHTLMELNRFRSIETQLTIAATQITASTAALVQIASDVKSLLASRSYTQGAWKTLTVVGSAFVAFVSAVWAFLGHKWPFNGGH